MELNDEAWAGAEHRLRIRVKQYEEMLGTPQVNVTFALTQIRALLARFEQGERNPGLYREIMTFK